MTEGADMGRQRIRLVLGAVQMVLAVVVMVIMLTDGSRWFGWLIAACSLGNGLLSLHSYRQVAKGGPHSA